MLKNTFLKTLFQKRWTTLMWFGAITVSIFGVSLMFPPIRDTMGSMMGTVPESMKNWFGTIDTWQTFAGFAGQEIFSQMAVLIVIMSIVFGAALLAGDESDGTLLTLLARPAKRASIYVQKYATLAVMITVVALGYFIGGVVGGRVLGEPVPYAAFFQATFMVWLLGMALGSLAYALGAATGKKAFAGLIVGFYAFIAYFISSLSTAAEVIDQLSYGSLFRYVAAPEVLINGLDWGDVAVLGVATIVPLIVALPIFARRDLKTR